MSLPLEQSAAPVDRLSDEEVVDRVRRGEVALYEILMRRYNQRLFRVARSVLADAGEAEDVMQDAYVRAFEKLHQFKGDARFSTWLTKIALYEAMARKRKRTRMTSLPSHDTASGGGGTAALPSRQPSPEHQAYAAELRRTLESAIDDLPETLRLAFLLREVEGMSTAEAAQALEIGESALKVRVHRARERLRSGLERRMGEAVREVHAFAGDRCDRVVAGVLRRLGIG